MNMAYTCYCVVALLLHIITCHYIVIVSSFSRSTTDSTKLSLRLIHRHSIIPPPAHSLSDNDDKRAPLIPMDDGALFLVNISIGEPPVPQLLAMDTGSNLIWAHCYRCDTCKKTTKIFDPEKSTTYTKISNTSRLCYDYNAIPSYISNGPKYRSQCSFGIKYEDQTTSNGVLALEKFTFLTSTGGTVEIPNVVLGCALDVGGPVGDLSGIFGLEVHNEHYFVSRTGNNRFSYCIGSIRDTGYMYNQLILGDGAVLQGLSTPIRIKNQHYVVAIEGISIGEKNLRINLYEFDSVMIDSGTTFMLLVKSAYEQLVEEVRRLMDGILNPLRNAGDLVCYYGDLEQDLKGFPIVSLHLAEGAEIDLDAEGLFQRTRDGSGFCMAVMESKSENMIGVMAQQYYNVGFNLDSMRVSFQRIDCELLED